MLPDLFSITGYIVGVGGALTILFSRVKSDNLNDLKDRVAILEAERAELKDALATEREMAHTQHLENQKAISKLEGQVELYRNLELASISGSLKELSASNVEILKTLKGDAKTAKDAQADGGLLVKTKPGSPLVVETEEPLTVETQKTKPLDVKIKKK